MYVISSRRRAIAAMCNNALQLDAKKLGLFAVIGAAVVARYSEVNQFEKKKCYQETVIYYNRCLSKASLVTTQSPLRKFVKLLESTHASRYVTKS